MNVTLPEPTIPEQQHSAKLHARIAAQIQLKGPLSFARFMEMALYEPRLGYYRAGWPTFGKNGDFITAPEISSLFGCCVARQCEQVLREFKQASIIELGAGSGALSVQILTELEKRHCLPAHYYILELSAQFQQRQRDTLKKMVPHLFSKVEWLSTLTPALCDGIVIANEVLDAMPVHQFRIENQRILECVVTCDEKKKLFIRSAISNTSFFIEKIKALQLEHIEGYTSEINLWLEPWLRTIAQAIKRGCLLFIDYGFPQHEYYLSQRYMGTLMCHYKHHAHADPLILLGVQDITAHVDFTAVANAANSLGLTVAGFTHQAAFLLNCGLLDEINSNQNDRIRFQQVQAIKQLTLPHEMGELFKVIALTKGDMPALLGFSQFNQVERL